MAKTEQQAIEQLRELLRPNLVKEDSEVTPYQIGYHDGMQRMARDAWEVIEMHFPESHD